MSQPKPDIPGYRILRRLGHGGMSEIWLAEQIALARPVAVKIVSLGQEADARLARFRLEASLIARFDHPNVVGIIEFGDTGDGRLYFSMPYVPNGTLAQSGLRGDVARVREVIAQVLDALAYVHQHGIVHRDVKPENVLFDSVGRARLADFGVSRSMEGVSRHTRVGETFGSSYYVSPEQARGEPLDGRSDLYSVGALVYELLTGHTPFKGPDDLSIVIAHLQAPVPKLPPELRRWQPWIDTALAKRPGHRFPDAAAMRAAMDRIPDSATAAGWPSRLRPLTIVAAAGAVILTIAIAWWLSADGASAPPRPDDASVPSAAVTMPPSLLPRSLEGTELPFDARESIGASTPPPATQAQGDLDAATLPAEPTSTPSGASPMPSTSTTPETANGAASPVDHGVDEAASADASPSAPPVSVRRRTAPGGQTRVPAESDPPSFAASFQSVPRIPLYLLSGSFEDQLKRIDDHLDWGRRAIEADRVDVESARRASDDREKRRALRAAYDTRKANYETWRRQLLELRKKVERSH